MSPLRRIRSRPALFSRPITPASSSLSRPGSTWAQVQLCESQSVCSDLPAEQEPLPEGLVELAQQAGGAVRPHQLGYRQPYTHC